MDEWVFDQAERTTEILRLGAILRAAAAVSQTGRKTCQDCDEPIDPRRRAAAPFAVRCMSCQKIAEGTE